MLGLDTLNGSTQGTFNSDLPLCCSAASTKCNAFSGHEFREHELHESFHNVSLCVVLYIGNRIVMFLCALQGLSIPPRSILSLI